MDYSVHIPHELVVRALPINDELAELVRQKQINEAKVAE